MEILNLLLIMGATIIILFWGLRKKREQKSYTVSVDEHLNNGEVSAKVMKNLTKDTEELDYVAEVFFNISKDMFRQIAKYSLIIIIFISVLVSYGFEENEGEYAQSVWFFIGATSQLFINFIQFYHHNFFDKKVIIVSRVSKWLAMDYMIKQNIYITVVNQGLNQLFFSTTYITSSYVSKG